MGNSSEEHPSPTASPWPAPSSCQETPLSYVSGIPRNSEGTQARHRRKPGSPWSSEAPPGGRGLTPLFLGAQETGGGLGTVTAVRNPSAAPTLWLSPGTSATSDKEVAPPAQEEWNNNPDTSAAALSLSEMTAVLGSLTASQAKEGDRPAWPRTQGAGRAARATPPGTEPLPALRTDPPAPSAGGTSAPASLSLSWYRSFRALGSTAVPRVTGLTPFAGADGSQAVDPAASSTVIVLHGARHTLTVPSGAPGLHQMPSELQTDQRHRATDPTDATTGQRQKTMDTFPRGTASPPVAKASPGLACPGCYPSAREPARDPTGLKSLLEGTRRTTDVESRAVSKPVSDLGIERYSHTPGVTFTGTDSTVSWQGVTTMASHSVALETTATSVQLSPRGGAHLGLTDAHSTFPVDAGVLLHVTEPEFGVKVPPVHGTVADTDQGQREGTSSTGNQSSVMITERGDVDASSSPHKVVTLVTRSLSDDKGYNVSLRGVSDEDVLTPVSTQGFNPRSPTGNSVTEDQSVSLGPAVPGETVSADMAVSPRAGTAFWEVETSVNAGSPQELSPTLRTQSDRPLPHFDQFSSPATVTHTTEPGSVGGTSKALDHSPHPHSSVPPQAETGFSGSADRYGLTSATAFPEPFATSRRDTNPSPFSGSSYSTSLPSTGTDTIVDRIATSHPPSPSSSSSIEPRGHSPLPQTDSSPPSPSDPPAHDPRLEAETSVLRGTMPVTSTWESPLTQSRQWGAVPRSPEGHSHFSSPTRAITASPRDPTNPADPESSRPTGKGLDLSSYTPSAHHGVASPSVYASPAGGDTVTDSGARGSPIFPLSAAPTSRTPIVPETLSPTVSEGKSGRRSDSRGTFPTKAFNRNISLPSSSVPTATVPVRSTGLIPHGTTNRTSSGPVPTTSLSTRAHSSLTTSRSPAVVPSSPEGVSSSTPPGPWLTDKTPSTSLNPRAVGSKGRVFITEDQPPVIKEEIVQVRLLIVLERESGGDKGPPKSLHPEDLEQDAVKQVEPFLQSLSGYHGVQASVTRTAEVQCDAQFGTGSALSWLGRPGWLLNSTGLGEAVRRGLYVSGDRVRSITVGELQSDLCTWLFQCPPGFQCQPAGLGNASCSSLCHTDYCKHSGICTHHSGQQPACQCPVGEDFWFMGRRCDYRMTRQRLVGIALGALLSLAGLMAALSCLALRRFKAMLIRAKVDQTRSSYRRFSRFDDLSGRFWAQSWPGSAADSLDNPAFSRSDELLHLRALDRTCCYHDDSLSISSTYPGSGAHLNTVYSRSSHYNWGLSDGSINDCMADSGKASDLSVCSWPIEPIQWTPFPLLHQLGIQRASKTHRPHSYCEGMELVDLERTWTA
ncbi:mucin-2 isoform X2 [Lepisosteus oculatus]